WHECDVPILAIKSTTLQFESIRSDSSQTLETSLTWKGSVVRSHYRPPAFAASRLRPASRLRRTLSAVALAKADYQIARVAIEDCPAENLWAAGRRSALSWRRSAPSAESAKNQVSPEHSHQSVEEPTSKNITPGTH